MDKMEQKCSIIVVAITLGLLLLTTHLVFLKTLQK